VDRNTQLVGALISLPRHMKTETNRSDTRLLTSMLECQIQLQMAECHAPRRQMKQSSSPFFYLLLWSLQLAPRSALRAIHQICDMQSGLQLHLNLLVLSMGTDLQGSTEQPDIDGDRNHSRARVRSVRSSTPSRFPSVVSVNHEHRQIGEVNTRM
jgi:hypothetical protein